MSSTPPMTRTIRYGVDGTRCKPLNSTRRYHGSFRHVPAQAPPVQTDEAYPTSAATASYRPAATAHDSNSYRRPSGVFDETAEKPSIFRKWRHLHLSDRHQPRSGTPTRYTTRKRTENWVRGSHKEHERTPHNDPTHSRPSRPSKRTATSRRPRKEPQTLRFVYEGTSSAPGEPDTAESDDTASSVSSETIQLPNTAPTPPPATQDEAYPDTYKSTSLITLPVSVTIRNPRDRNPTIIIEAANGLTVEIGVIRRRGGLLFSSYNKGSTLTVDRRESSGVLHMCRNDELEAESTLKVPLSFDFEPCDRKVLQRSLRGLDPSLDQGSAQ